ncbi:unnamed protein product [marine sediment metagenome]|uniref:Uncharacterized protein n=1 Tax=marine sediment metagenome TaxID=412755 RepID=X1PLU8_9ZZZZ
MLKKLLQISLVLIFFAFFVFIPFKILKTRADIVSDLVTEYLFPVSGTLDVIGVKVINNSKGLSPLAWYKKKCA